MPSYADLIETTITREKSILGEDHAIARAAEVEGLRVSDDGHVLGLDRDGKTVFADLLERYEDLAGPVALTLIAKAIRDAYGDDIDVDLPDALAEHDVF